MENYVFGLLFSVIYFGAGLVLFIYCMIKLEDRRRWIELLVPVFFLGGLFLMFVSFSWARSKIDGSNFDNPFS